MKFNSDIHHRRSIRLKAYDYSQPGVYFVTVCTQNREPIFGHIQKSSMILNESGEMIKKWWEKIPIKFDNTKIDLYVIMPNHIHMILIINNPKTEEYLNFDKGKNTVLPLHKNYDKNILNRNSDNIVGVDPCINPDSHIKIGTKNNFYKHHGKLYGLPKYISWFKRMTTNEYIRNVRYKNWEPFDKKLWQRNYYEHIIKYEKELNKYREYIKNNPLKWDEDEENS
jgi:putative transposase